jgi:hypothetical protein
MKFILLLILSIVFVNAINLKEQKTYLKNVTKDTATIDIGSLIVGQSGLVVHNFKKRSIILTNAIVTATSKDSSTIKFIKSNILKQDALPNTNLIPQNNDLFVLNNLYSTSLLIVPNYDVQTTINHEYPQNNFIDIDIFAAFLKMEDTPLPTKEEMVNFAKHNNIGTIYIVIKDKLYILDVLTFKVIKTQDIIRKNQKIQVPFFTNVQDITKSFWSWFSEDKIKDYDKYYSNLIGLTNDRK